MMVATAIDATDGWLARKARVKEVLPGFDGGALDNLIDFQTYVTLPLLLIWRAGHAARRPRVAPAAAAARQRLRLLAGQRQDRRRVLPRLPVILEHRRLLSVTCCSRQCGCRWRSSSSCVVLTFVPTPYLYATRGGPFAKSINIGSAIWFVSLGFVLFGPEESAATPVALLSLRLSGDVSCAVRRSSQFDEETMKTGMTAIALRARPRAPVSTVADQPPQTVQDEYARLRSAGAADARSFRTVYEVAFTTAGRDGVSRSASAPA